MKHRKNRRRFLFFLLSLFLSAGFQAIPWLLSAVLPDLQSAALLIHAFFLYAAHPVCAAVFPFLLTRKYLFPALTCFFHFGIFLLFLPFYPDGKVIGLICLVIGVFSAAVGETLRQREDDRHAKNRKWRNPHP